MLYLRTGANGTFKTALTLWDIRKMQLAENRQVLFVKDRFKANPILTDDFGWTPIEFKDWLKHKNCIILADEAHRDLPKVSESTKRPEHIEMLAEHRSFGHDFFILDQHPLNIDPFVRRLIGAPGYHQHFLRVLGAANAVTVHQWDSVNPTCERPGAGKNAQTQSRGPEKEVYGWYESASLHTGKLRIPKQVWTLLMCALLLGVMVYLLVTKYMPGSTGTAKPATAPAAAQSSMFGVSGPAGDERKPMTPAEYSAAYRPRLAGLMHTAPAYDKLTEPRRVPVPAACVEMRSVGCKCYTQDATPYPVELDMCRQLVAHGAFLAFQAEGERANREPAPMPRQATETALPLPRPPILIDGGQKSAGASTAVSAGGAPEAASQARVQPGSKWSFQTAGQ